MMLPPRSGWGAMRTSHHTLVCGMREFGEGGVLGVGSLFKLFSFSETVDKAGNC